MIHEVEGDILLTKAQVIAHGVAACDPMNSGLALAIHQKYPVMHKDFHHWCHQHTPKPGSAWMWGGVGGIRIVNLMTQEGGGAHGSRPSKATTSHVKHALRELKKMIDKEGFTSVALPRLATGVGGLAWSDVLPLIQEQLGDVAIPIYVYSTYHAGQAAAEPGIEG
jgi:O-acetyl-ADP-ribose deacetylase (regulator of RNase III)